MPASASFLVREVNLVYLRCLLIVLILQVLFSADNKQQLSGLLTCETETEKRLPQTQHVSSPCRHYLFNFCSLLQKLEPQF